MIEFFNSLWSLFLVPIQSLSQLDNPLVYPAFMFLLGWVFQLLYKFLGHCRGKSLKEV